MSNELNELLNNYEKVIYGKEEISKPTIHQIHLLLDYIANLQQENQELKKQLEENKLNHKQLKDLDKIENSFIKIKNQQKEFISYLEEKEKEFDILGDPKNAGACKGILRKYQEIIGNDINVGSKGGKDER